MKPNQESNIGACFKISLFMNLQDNYTGLHLAVEAGKSGVVEALLGHGAQVHIRGKWSFLLPITIHDVLKQFI